MTWQSHLTSMSLCSSLVFVSSFIILWAFYYFIGSHLMGPFLDGEMGGMRLSNR